MLASIGRLIAAIFIAALMVGPFAGSTFAETTKETNIFMRPGEKPATDLRQLDCQGHGMPVR
jgi:hypothetical protein